MVGRCRLGWSRGTGFQPRTAPCTVTAESELRTQDKTARTHCWPSLVLEVAGHLWRRRFPKVCFCCDRVFHGHGSDSCVHGNAHYLGLPTPTYYSTVPLHSEPESFQWSFDTEPKVYGALACTLPCKVGVPVLISSHGPVAPVCARSRKTVATCTMRPDFAICF